MSTSQDLFFDAISKRKMVRASIRAIIIKDNELLVQIPKDSKDDIYAFIDGEYEYGDSFESRIKVEIEEETNAKVLTWKYLFVVENKFLWNGKLIHGLEHYLLVDIDRKNIESKEAHLTQKWIPLKNLSEFDVRPEVVKNLILSNDLFDTKHLVIS